MSAEILATKEQFLAEMEGDMLVFERELKEVSLKIDAFGPSCSPWRETCP